MRFVVSSFIFGLMCLVSTSMQAATADAPVGSSGAADLSGQWYLDKDVSDNLLKKFKAQITKAQRRANRNGGGQAYANGYRMPIFRSNLLMKTLPSFLRLSEVMRINQDDVKVEFDYAEEALRRQVFTDERPTSITLLSAAKGKDRDNVTVSSWERGKLIIETTSALDVKIEEVYELLPGDSKSLQNTVTILHPLFPKPMRLVLIYQYYNDVPVTIAKD